MRCPLCGFSGTSPLLRLPAPAGGSFLTAPGKNARDARKPPDLRLLTCASCRFVFLADSPAKTGSRHPSQSFGYLEDARLTRYRRSLRNQLLRIATSSSPDRPLRVIDVGCGDGSFAGLFLGD